MELLISFRNSRTAHPMLVSALQRWNAPFTFLSEGPVDCCNLHANARQDPLSLRSTRNGNKLRLLRARHSFRSCHTPSSPNGSSFTMIQKYALSNFELQTRQWQTLIMHRGSTLSSVIRVYAVSVARIHAEN
jgi:hypothetical protein